MALQFRQFEIAKKLINMGLGTIDNLEYAFRRKSDLIIKYLLLAKNSEISYNNDLKNKLFSFYNYIYIYNKKGL